MKLESVVDVLEDYIEQEVKEGYVPHRKKDFVIKNLDKFLEEDIVNLN